MDATAARENLLDHYENPRHKGALGHATRSHELNNPICGDRISMQLRVENDVVSDIGFDGRGCIISQAAASMLSEAVLGRTVDEICALDGQFVLDMIGVPLTATRVKCALLSLETLKRAVQCTKA
jgi:nitrogen fixation NifU-like protein